MNRCFSYLFLLLLLLSAGCASIIDAHSQKKEFRTFYEQNNKAEAEIELRDYLDSRRGTGDEIMWQLEAGSFFFRSGNYEESIAAFDAASELIEQYDSRAVVSARDVGSEGGAILTNAAAIPYRGMYRDRVFLDIYRAFSRLGSGDEDNFRVEMNRVRQSMETVAQLCAGDIASEKEELEEARKKNEEKLREAQLNAGNAEQLFMKNEQLQEELKITGEAARPEYGNLMNPLALFLSGIYYTRDNDTENALIEFKRLYDAFPESKIVSKLYVTALKNGGRTEIPEKLKKVEPFAFSVDRNVVYVIVANGMIANYRQMKVELVLPYAGYTGLAFPVCEYRSAPFGAFTVSAEGYGSCQAVMLADGDAIVANEYKLRMPAMVTRLIIGYLVKEAVTIAANEAARQSDNSGVYISTVIGTSLYKYLFNTADTRCWEILGKEYLVAVIPMPLGRKLTISADGMGEKTVNFSSLAKSAICYVAAPTAANVECLVLEFTDK